MSILGACQRSARDRACYEPTGGEQTQDGESSNKTTRGYEQAAESLRSGNLQ